MPNVGVYAGYIEYQTATFGAKREPVTYPGHGDPVSRNPFLRS